MTFVKRLKFAQTYRVVYGHSLAVQHIVAQICLTVYEHSLVVQHIVAQICLTVYWVFTLYNTSILM
jgi:hypothetical protein